MKLYYNGQYKVINKLGKETIYEKLEDIPNYERNITEVEIEDGTKRIGSNAFMGCDSLKK